MADKLRLLQAEITDHLEQICLLFTHRPKITIVIRTPWLDAESKEGGVVLSDDDFDLAIAQINKLRNRKTVSGGNGDGE